ncbi:MAG: hypothetical protein JJU45_10360 [Acidimicrobiia bacterium]|nr:hypothetical protein [Acidimicrobiia bacterium]
MRSKLLAILMATVVVFGVGACGGDDSEPAPADDAADAPSAPVEPGQGEDPVDPGTDPGADTIETVPVNAAACDAVAAYVDLGAVDASDPAAFEAGIRANNEVMQQLAAAAEPSWEAQATSGAEGYAFLIEQLGPYDFEMDALPSDVRQEVGQRMLGSEGEQLLRLLASVQVSCAEIAEE